MGEYVLTVVDTAGIQNYVFGTNNLQQISGASHLVNCATRDWLLEALSGMAHNSIDFASLEHPYGKQRMEDSSQNLDAELIYAGGGNTVLVFSGYEKAVQFTRKLTKKILTEAPGLNVVVIHKCFNWNQPMGGSGGILNQAFRDLLEAKSRARHTSLLLGRSVTAECVFTSLPAVGRDYDGRLVSAESAAKRANNRTGFNGILGKIDLRTFAPPAFDFEQLGMSQGEKSLLAIVHIDGNGMGRRLQNILAGFNQGGDMNREVILALRRFSISIQKAANEAMQTVVDRVVAAVDPETETIGGQVPIIEGRLPFRPIVFGGDDVTFVCDGRLGLGLAAAYLSELNSRCLSDGRRLSCRAGVAIVKAHYPFARAYALAERLCASAKHAIRTVRDTLDRRARRQSRAPVEMDISAIDWHMATVGALAGLEDIRLREYQVEAGSLTARPLITCLEPVEKELPSNEEFAAAVDFPDRWRSWDNFLTAVDTFKNGDSWAERHNKVKTLREVLRSGPESVAHFDQLYNPIWPRLDHVSQDALNQGWAGQTCLYFDAVETADLFIPLP